MAKNRKTPDMNLPVWFDGQNINEALFCEEFLQERRIIFANGAFFTPDGRVTDDLPLRGEIYEKLKFCAVNTLFVVLLLFIERCHLIELPDILDFQSELIMRPDCGFLHGFSQLRDIAVYREIVCIAHNRIYKPVSLSSAYLCLLINVSQNIAHNIIEQPCWKISAYTKMVPRIIAHKSAQKP